MPDLTSLATTYTTRLADNISTSFSSLSLQQWIRLIAAVGAYLLARPYIIKLGAKRQLAQLEEEDAAAQAAAAEVSANELRDGRGNKVAVPEDSDSEDEGAEGAGSSGADWGKKARRRQRRLVKSMLEAHEKKLAEEQEDEEDKDIQEFLVE